MMASNSKRSSYQRLEQEIWLDEEDHNDIREKVVGSLRNGGGSRFRFRRSFYIRRNLRVRIPSLRRFLRRKARLIKLAWYKVYKRLMQSRSHFGDLFAGNYLFMQVNPVSLKSYSNYSGGNVNNGVVHHKPGLVVKNAHNQLQGLSASSHRINV